MKLVLVTNIPAPYRIPIFNRIARELGDNFLVVFCARLEPDRLWDLGSLEFRHVFLKESFVKRKNVFIHCNSDVIRKLRKFQPDVVVTTGFNPTHLLSWLYTLFSTAGHVPMTDGWLHSEKDLSLAHRIARKLVFRSSRSYIGASRASLELFRSYGVADNCLFQSHLCIDNDRFEAAGRNQQRSYDLMYSGQIIERKVPDFFVKVVAQVKARLGSVSVLVIGDGPQRKGFLDALKALDIDVTYAGFVSQAELPGHYASAKVLLFTTRNDPWGIVANEALASGTPVITSPFAGVANDLVLNGVNGYILDLEVTGWAQKTVALLSDDLLLQRMRRNAFESVKPFNFANAAQGIMAAARHAIAGNKAASKRSPRS